MTDRTPNVAAKVLDPSQHFRTSADILAAKNLNRAAKMQLLRAMERDARELQTADDKNMPGGETDALREVLLAIEKLDLEVKHKSEPPPDKPA